MIFTLYTWSRGLYCGGANSGGQQGAGRNHTHPLSQANKVPQGEETLVSDGSACIYTGTCKPPNGQKKRVTYVVVISVQGL